MVRALVSDRMPRLWLVDLHGVQYRAHRSLGHPGARPLPLPQQGLGDHARRSDLKAARHRE